jgi:hypothetical protein
VGAGQTIVSVLLSSGDTTGIIHWTCLDGQQCGRAWDAVLQLAGGEAGARALHSATLPSIVAHACKCVLPRHGGTTRWPAMDYSCTVLPDDDIRQRPHQLYDPQNSKMQSWASYGPIQGMSHPEGVKPT